MASFSDTEETSLLDKLDSIAPIREFDAFPKVATTYYTRTPLGGLVTVLVIALSFLLSLNDIGEFVWGWPDIEYTVERDLTSLIDVNLDMVIAMPCNTISIDVRDAVGDRLHLTSSFIRDGTHFDSKQAHKLHAHGNKQSTQKIVTAARKKSGGVFAVFKGQPSAYRPTYNHIPSGDACRVYGTVSVRRVTGNLHITALGHGYSSHEHTDHKLINMTHMITELSFGPYFPNIAQPLDYTLEQTNEPFTMFQYYLTVIPTIYKAPRSKPLRTNQYSATSYQHQIEHGRGSPGIFFRFDVEPIEMTVWQRTTTFSQFFIRLCGVIGGIWVCAGWGVKVFSKAVTVVGKDGGEGTIGNESQAALRKKVSQRWGGGELRPRTGSSGGWTIDGGAPFSANPYSPYAGTPTVAVNGYPGTPNTANGVGAYGALSPASVPLPSTPGVPSHYPTSPYPNVRATGGAVSGFPLSPITPPRRDSSPYATSPTASSPVYAQAATGSASSLRPKSNLNPSTADKRLD